MYVTLRTNKIKQLLLNMIGPDFFNVFKINRNCIFSDFVSHLCQMKATEASEHGQQMVIQRLSKGL